ncbi:Bud site selection protein [Umbelopsis nana]
MRDRLRNEEILDFYLDLKHHEVLWRKYIRSLSRGGMLDEADLKDGFNSISVAIKVQMFEKKMSVQSASLESSMKRDAASKTPDIIKQHEEQIINSHEVHEAAERIAHRYVVQSAHKEIVELPVSIRNDIIDFMQDERRFDPLIFANAKTWSFNAIQHSSYPKFMDIKSKGNITQWQQIFRLCLGLSALFVAFTLELTMMFLGWQVWGVRVWGLLPFWIATWSLISGLTALDPLLIILFNLSIPGHRL